MTLIVGVHPAKDDRCALELAATMARSAEQDLSVVIVVPTPWSSPLAARVDPAYEEWAAEVGQQAVERAKDVLAESFPDVQASASWIGGTSVPGTLIEQAEACDASLIVVGSGAAGPYGRIHVSSTAETLLHSSPIAVAVATRGYRSNEAGGIARATLAFRGDAMSRRILARTAELCASAHISLRLVTFAVHGKLTYAPHIGFRTDDQVAQSWAEQSTAAQQAALADIEDVPDDVECVVAQGSSWSEVIDAVPWSSDDVLVVGSSQNRGLSRLFLGSTATKIARNSPVPVIVVP